MTMSKAESARARAALEEEFGEVLDLVKIKIKDEGVTPELLMAMVALQLGPQMLEALENTAESLGKIARGIGEPAFDQTLNFSQYYLGGLAAWLVHTFQAEVDRFEREGGENPSIKRAELLRAYLGLGKDPAPTPTPERE